MISRNRFTPNTISMTALAIVIALTVLGHPALGMGAISDLRGVNLSGAEFGNVFPGVNRVDYSWPTSAEVRRYAAKGASVIRIPIRWERIQPTPFSALDENGLLELERIATEARATGLICIFDLHNGAGFVASGQPPILTAASAFPNALSDVWLRLANRFRDNQYVWFGLLNEPHNVSAKQWAITAQTVVNAIRATTAMNYILLPGAAYSSGNTWIASQNGDALAQISDHSGHLLIEIHQYLDNDGSGTHLECIPNSGKTSLTSVQKWLRSRHFRGFLAEIAIPTSSPHFEACENELSNLLTMIEKNSDAWAGWTIWGAGSAWSPAYPFVINGTPISEQFYDFHLRRR